MTPGRTAWKRTPKVLETLAIYLHEQGLVSHPLAIDQLFAPNTIAL